MSFLNDYPIFDNFVLPVIDIILLSYLLYKIYEILEETRAIQLMRGAFILGLVYAAAWFLRLSALLWVLGFIAPGLFIGLAIVFQPELRSIFARIGQRDIFGRKIQQKPFQIGAILDAAVVLSRQNRGGLIVFARRVGLRNIIDTGTIVDAQVNSALVISIFGYDGPLHDGAVIIQGGRVAAAGCLLPLAREPDIRHSFGTRHRAALGLSEETDAVILVISEETSALTLAYDGNLFYDLNIDEIKLRLHEILDISTTPGKVNSGGAV